MSPTHPVISPASSFTDSDLISAFNRAYSDYYVPIQLSEAAWHMILARFDVDLEASRASTDGAGIALLGLRGERGWVGGMGVAPKSRRAGLGRRLMESLIEQARCRAVSVLWLEVLEQNAPAIALYDALGFVRRRVLDVWLLEAPIEAPGAREIATADAMSWIAEHRQAPEPWQREDASVLGFDAPEHPLRGLEVSERGRRVGAAVALATTERASLLQAATVGERRGETARALCAGARGSAPALRFLNVPTDDPVSGALSEAGATLEARQLEMSLAIAP